MCPSSHKKEEALNYEATRFAELAATSVSASLRGIFTGETATNTGVDEKAYGTGNVLEMYLHGWCRYDGSEAEQVRRAGQEGADRGGAGGRPDGRR